MHRKANKHESEQLEYKLHRVCLHELSRPNVMYGAWCVHRTWEKSPTR
jgi:hypothetical protein